MKTLFVMPKDRMDEMTADLVKKWATSHNIRFGTISIGRIITLYDVSPADEAELHSDFLATCIIEESKQRRAT